MIKTHTAFPASFVLALLLAHHVAQAQTLSASLGWGTFVEGMDSVINVFTLKDPPAGTTGVTILFYKSDITHPLTVRFDFKQQNDLVQGVDMGQLEPGAKVQAICYNASKIPIGTTPEYTISVLPEPSWLQDARLSNIRVSGTNVKLHADYNIPTELNSAVPDTITGIGGRAYRLKAPSVGMDLTYHTATRETTVGSSLLAFSVNLFGQRETRRGIPLKTGISLDQDFNLRIKVADSIGQQLFSASIPWIVIPLPAFCDISVDVGITVGGMLKGQVVVGNGGDQWGFVRDGSDATGITTKLFALGFVRGSFNVLGGLLLKVEGKLSILAQLGGGLEYVNVPASETTPTFGGNISVYGEAGARALWFFEFWHVGPEELYRKDFGHMPGKIVAESSGALLKATTVLVDSTPPMPQYAPQPAISTYDGTIGVAWLDSLRGRSGLWLAMKDRAADRFEAPVLIASNDHGIGAPAVAVLPGGSALVAWTQNRYTTTGAPSGIGLRRLIAAQDVRVVFRDNTAGTVSPPMMMADDTTTAESGRAEAEPRVCVVDEASALIAWLAQTNPGTSQVYYARLTRAGQALGGATPQPIAGVTGMNRNLQLIQLSSGTALAVWTTDPDGVDSTYDMRVMSAAWDGSGWSAPVEVARADQRASFGPTALAATNGHAVLAWSSTANDTSGAVTNGLYVRTWDNANAQWSADGGYVLQDSAASIQNVTASIGSGAQAVVAWQRVPFNDTAAVGYGARGLLMRDLNDAGSAWRTATGLPFLSDTTAYVWSALTAFGPGDDFHTLTEEQPRAGSMNIPAGGVRFGSNERGLVWRSLSVAPDLTVSERPEPGTPVSSVTNARGPLLAELHVWPNPTRNDFAVTYSLRAASPVTVDIVDALGRLVARVVDTRMLEAGTYQTHVATEGLASGMYWVVVRSDGEVRRERVGVGR